MAAGQPQPWGLWTRVEGREPGQAHRRPPDQGHQPVVHSEGPGTSHSRWHRTRDSLPRFRREIGRVASHGQLAFRGAGRIRSGGERGAHRDRLSTSAALVGLASPLPTGPESLGGSNAAAFVVGAVPLEFIGRRTINDQRKHTFAMFGNFEIAVPCEWLKCRLLLKRRRPEPGPVGPGPAIEVLRDGTRRRGF